MDIPQIISNILTSVILTIIIGAGYTLARLIEARLPANLQKTLIDVAQVAVQQVEQQYGLTLHGIDKKGKALETVDIIFKRMMLPAPDPEVVSAAIEYAVGLLNQKQGQVLPITATLETTTK